MEPVDDSMVEFGGNMLQKVVQAVEHPFSEEFTNPTNSIPLSPGILFEERGMYIERTTQS